MALHLASGVELNNTAWSLGLSLVSDRIMKPWTKPALMESYDSLINLLYMLG